MTKKAVPKKADRHVTAAAKFDPKSWRDELKNGAAVLKHTRDATVGFVQEYFDSRADGGKGTTSDREQDQLRAGLVFATGGLDSLLKHLIREAIPALADRNANIANNLRDFAEKRIGRETGRQAEIGAGFLARALISQDPKSFVIEEYVYELTGSSLQSIDQIQKTASAFAITDKDLTHTINGLKTVFDARNGILHEMDIDFTKPNRSRRARKQDETIRQMNAVLSLGEEFLRKVDVQFH